MILNGSQVDAARVQFDVSPAVGCSTIDDEQFSAAVLDERLVSCTLQVSALITDGKTDDIAELLYEAVAPEQRMVVHDYAPRTTLATDVVGNINVQKANSDGKRASIGLNGTFQSIIRADASGGAESSESTSKNYEVLPPQELIAAAGTANRGRGVYFKLKPSAQTSLEGAREFQLILRVPNDWRGDYLRVSCRARTARGENAGQASFLVPLYDQDDLQAKRLAINLNRRERELLTITASYRGQVDRMRKPTVMHELALARPEIPANWLVQVLAANAGSPTLPFEKRLPPAVQSAITKYRRALHHLTALPPSAHEMLLTAGKATVVPSTNESMTPPN